MKASEAKGKIYQRSQIGITVILSMCSALAAEPKITETAEGTHSTAKFENTEVRLLGADAEPPSLLAYRNENNKLFIDYHNKKYENDLQKAKDLGLKLNGKGFAFSHFDQTGTPVYFKNNSINAAAMLSTSRLFPSGGEGLSLDGSTETISIWELGRTYSGHQEFGSRVTIVDTDSNWLDDDHATQVASIIMASGVDSNAKGMAPAALLRVFSTANYLSELGSEGASGRRVVNHSFGYPAGWAFDGVLDYYWYGDSAVSTTEDWKFGYYNDSAAALDAAAANNNTTLIVRSAGNDRNDHGPTTGQHWEWYQTHWFLTSATRGNDGGSSGFDSLEPLSTAKNLLSIGAIKDFSGNYSSPSNVIIEDYSAWGPTDDGRIKPDLVGNGEYLYSALSSSSTSYGGLIGTSASAPNVSGSILLLHQYYRTFFGSTAPWSSTIKDLILHTTDEAGSANGPDYKFGWGLMNTTKAAKLLKTNWVNQSFNLRQGWLQDGTSTTIKFRRDNSKVLKVSATWTDVAAQPITPGSPALNNTTSRLVNDLDLKVVRPSTAVYYPWKLDGSNPNNSAIQGVNHTDNVEIVEALTVPASDNGLCSVVLSHSGSLTWGGQNYSLGITGTEASGYLTWGLESTNSLVEYGRKVVAANSGYIYVGSYVFNGIAGHTIRLVKYNPAADQQWIYSFTPRVGSIDLIDMALDSDENIILLGKYTTSANADDFWINKLSSSGVSQWTTTYASLTGVYNDTPAALAIDASNNIFACGKSDSVYNGYEASIVKISPTGTTLASNIFSTAGDDSANAITIDSSGYVYVAGFRSKASNSSLRDALLVKYGSTLSQLAWDAYGRTTTANDEFTTICLDPTGYVLAAGYSTSANEDYFLTKNHTSTLSNSYRRYYDAGYGNDRATKIALKGGYVYVGGEATVTGSGTDVRIVQFTFSNGANNGYNYASTSANDSLASLVVSGNNLYALAQYSSDYRIYKINEDRTTDWSTTWNGSGNSTDVPTAIAVDFAGNIYITGNAIGTDSINNSTLLKYGHQVPAGI
jgi:hypothetical protein